MNPANNNPQMAKIMNAIFIHGAQIFNMMPPGATVEVIIPAQKIFIPGRPLEPGGKLIITKPAQIMALVQQQPGDNGGDGKTVPFPGSEN